MQMQNSLFAAFIGAMLGVMPVAADIRPMPRPFPVAAADSGETAIRPMRNPVYRAALSVEIAPAPVAALPPVPLALLTGLVAPAATTDFATLPVDPPLLAAVRKVPHYEVVTSTANAPPAPLALGPALRPRSRPVAEAALAVAIRPMPRPAFSAPAPDPRPEAVLVPAVATVAQAMRPEPRPRGLAQRRAPDPQADIVLAAVTPPMNPGKPLVRSKKGSVCGDPSIRGETIPPIPAKMRGCGVAEPVRVTEIDGIRLSTPATIDCTTARAMKSWINTGLRPAFGRKNPPVALNIAASYACRPRNNIPGNPVSEHGRGKAVDISGIVLKSGAVVDVLRDYRGSKALRAAHRAGCGPFGTTLGPGSDGYHENHLHFDTANMGRPYCR